MGDDSTPLHYCCSQGQAQLAEALLATGRLDVNKPGAQGWYALHLAVRRGSLPCVQLLLRHGAGVDVKTDQGKTPVDIALVNKRAQIAEVLQGAGASTSTQT
jgi:ankyrin repeat protein